ncbi:retrovirus-related pol polyprotein from transposon TNT 1-94 [Tanacetum coccineum]|uniref:Retrovirus-related pol polyprotein from transposon TNT 1-94 n=1 Tax=Tanacetum coccineum TaxID=301880 RepID=A0ABQ5CD37_9ASTR
MMNLELSSGIKQDWLLKVLFNKKELTMMKPLHRNMIFRAFATYMNFKVFQMDVKSAFLNGKLKEEVYVKQPPGFDSSEFPNYVCKLDKALYVLKQAPRAWYETLSSFLVRNKFVRGKIDNTLFIFKTKGDVLLVQVYVDDIIFGSTNYKDDKGISICQEKYTRDLLKKYEISDSSSVKAPMVPLNNLGPDLTGKPISVQYKRITSHCYEKNSQRQIGLLSAKKQQSVAMSSAEAEYVAAVGCCANILFMESQLSDYDIHYKMVPICYDNTSTAISNNPVLYSRTKHIDIRYYFIRDHILKGDIELHFIPTEYQLVDIFIKPLDKPTFTRLKSKLGMLNID